MDLGPRGLTGLTSYGAEVFGGPSTGRLEGRAWAAAIDAFHHLVYAAATGLAFELISNGRRDGAD